VICKLLHMCAKLQEVLLLPLLLALAAGMQAPL
jgi:hypothetical protein